MQQHLLDVGHVERGRLGVGVTSVGQPLSSLVLYWNQSTDSVIGMIGMSSSIAASIFFMIATCSASLGRRVLVEQRVDGGVEYRS